ncbi:M20 family metallopeptidase [Alkalicoccobacillus murimartini]|uniref:Aminobenzoyl-glutamate utilization protein B n=1 Tax=Alkalicoccobacillus murimartini TaxID=171685 RepID=A0ABT9YIN8_9BACI|nr:M20 family metallopeptidase [Alkalicoccobacillus murimartini]MDQ0207725.1 aminobenzoyl-glutamate utilization protein B [Alkalicoccobacillus murimartini]
MPEFETIRSIIDRKQPLFDDIAHQIWNLAELRFEEKESSKLLSSVLEQEGFEVDYNVAGLSTAFTASYGSGSPVVSFLGEFDALSQLSQKPSISYQDPVFEGESGHGCGHHLLGTGALASAVAVRHYLDKHQLPGTVRFYGCPGEEGGSGKAFMAREGVFDDIDTAITWHPGSYNSLFAFESLANYQVSFRFKGKASHAAASPHLGRSALDAVELMNVGVNYLREHMIDEARVHYAIVNSGGLSPNVVQAEAEVLYLIRAPELSQVNALYKRVQDIAKGAALMTETTFDIHFEKGCSNYVRNHVLEEQMTAAFQAVPAVSYTDEERSYAKAIQASITEEERTGFFKDIEDMLPDDQKNLLDTMKNKDLLEDVIPTTTKKGKNIGSTDVGDVSWIAPTVQCFTTCFTAGTPFHTWQMVTQGASTAAYKGMKQASLVMADTAIRLFESPELISKAKEEHQSKLAGKSYICPIPKGVSPSYVR